MVKIKIGSGEERDIKDAEAHWINDQISNRRKDKQPVCVKITFINEGPVKDLILLSKDCQKVGYETHQMNTQEEKIYDLWEKHRLDEADFSGGNLVAFLKQLSNLL